MRTSFCLLIVSALAGIQAKAANSKNGDGIVVNSEYIQNNEIYQEKETTINRLSSDHLKDEDCKDGGKKPSTESCRKYYECKNNKYEEHSCVWPWKFDSTTLTCILWGAKCAEPDPVTKPTDPVTRTTEPVTEPTGPVTKPTDPVTKPTDPETKPTDPVTKPTDPETGPTNPEPNTSSTESNDQTTPTSSAGHQLPPLIIITLFTYLHTSFSLRS